MGVEFKAMGDIKTDLENRTLKLSLDVIKLVRGINQDVITRPIINQLVKSATSIGANYREANNAISRAEFRQKLYICKKEAQETGYWIDILNGILDRQSKELIEIKEEVSQLTKILQTIVTSLKIAK